MRLFETLAVVVLFVGVVMADIPIPPLGKDEKELRVYKEAVLGKDVTGYVFYQKWTRGGKDLIPGQPDTVYEKVELNTKKAMPLHSGGSLYAVREEDAKAYKTDQELNAALVKGKVKPIYTGFGGGYEMRVKKADIDDDSLTLTYTITGIDEKGKVTVKRDGKHTDRFTEDGSWKPKSKEPEEPLALAEPGYLIGGLAAALAVTFGGVWLARRRRTV